MTAIDYLGYPHIIDVLFDHCSRPALIALRGACKLWKARADDLLARHISLSTCPEGDMVVEAYDPLSPFGNPAPLPALMSYYLDMTPCETDLLDLLAPSVRVITFEPGVRITRRNAFFWSLPNVRMILDTADARLRSQEYNHTAHLPLCDIYVSQTPANNFKFRSGIVPVRHSGRIVLPVKEPKGVRPIQCLDLWSQHQSYGEIFIVFLPADPVTNPDGIRLGWDHRGMLHMLEMAAISAAVYRYAPDTRLSARITFVNLATWIAGDATEEEVCRIFLDSLAGFCRRAGSPPLDGDKVAKVKGHRRFITLEEYRNRVGEEQVALELQFMRKGD